MFPYDPQLAAAVAAQPESIADVIRTMQAIDALCVEGDGLKWFNGLYLQVTDAVNARVAAGGFADPAWLAELDVQFAGLYFGALRTNLSPRPQQRRDAGAYSSTGATNLTIARIQFALAGVNAHINHDLPIALAATSVAAGLLPRTGARAIWITRRSTPRWIRWSERPSSRSRSGYSGTRYRPFHALKTRWPPSA